MRDSRYVLVIAEKPKAADKIAAALNLSTRRVVDGVRVWEGFFNGRRFLVAPAVGHLFSLDTEETGFPVFTYRWVPKWLVEKKSRYARKYYEALKNLARGASEYVNACDYDIEGSVIGYLIIKNFGDLNRSRRAKFSSLTQEELVSAFKNLQPLDVRMVEAGLCRHEIDWIWGINVSRALMSYYKKVFSNFKVLSAGRVQTPTLIEVFRKHVERESFVPELKFSIFMKLRIGNEELSVRSDFGRDLSEEEANSLRLTIKKVGKARVVDVKSRTEILKPPPPFNLPDLQYEAYRTAKISPAETLNIAESLYLDQLISYPRTNSQKLPKTLNHRAILRNLSTLQTYREYVSELLKKSLLTPVEGVKDDPAHPAIYPTGYLSKEALKNKEWLIYDLIVRRYLASLSDEALLRTSTYVLKILDFELTITSQELIREGWFRIYNYRKISTSKKFSLRLGEEVPILDVKVVKTYSKPPATYTKSSLLEWMERSGIGTEATRAEIIETLFKRGYLKQTASGVDITELGSIVSTISANLFSELSSVQLTREVEEKLNKIIVGEFSRDDVVKEVISVLRPRLINVKKLLESDESINELRRLAGLNDGGSSCVLCQRLAEFTYDGLRLCVFHGRAYEELKKTYEVWSRKTKISFSEFLNVVSTLRPSGRYVKEVAKLLLTRKK
ncbi:MAG: DNA topoisomerase I [Desulfurococcaceae archaeon TW002]